VVKFLRASTFGPWARLREALGRKYKNKQDGRMEFEVPNGTLKYVGGDINTVKEIL